MRYEGTIYRPPSEAYSLIIQATIGCSHNKCTFCSMFKDKKFRIRKLDKVLEDIEEAKYYYSNIDRIFIADGNALVLDMEYLAVVLEKIKKTFPKCERVGIYGAPKDIIRKSAEDLKRLKDMGIGIIYLGIESGSDEILQCVKKGVTSKEIIAAGKKVKDSGIKLSVTLISGLGGKLKWKEHAIESAKIVNKIEPDYIGLLTLLVKEGTELEKEVIDGEFTVLTPEEVLLETKLFVTNVKLDNCIFRSNHASNYISLGGVLSRDNEMVINQINNSLKNKYHLKVDNYRRL